VDISHVVTDDTADAHMGTFFMLPDQERVFYQRRHSSFAKQAAPGLFPWDSVFGTGDGVWYHATGISPLCSDAAADNWSESLRVAARLNVPIRCV
jgi:hypothetical protein